jgi:hypothetical protein
MGSAICAAARTRPTKSLALGDARAAIAAGADDPATRTTTGFVLCLVEPDYRTAMNAIDDALAVARAILVCMEDRATAVNALGRLVTLLQVAMSMHSDIQSGGDGA